MTIQRKQPKLNSNPNIDSFIKNATATSTPEKTEEPLNNKTGRKIISLSLMEKDSTWIDQVLRELNLKTSRKITRTEIFSVAIEALQGKSMVEILEMTQRR